MLSLLELSEVADAQVSPRARPDISWPRFRTHLSLCVEHIIKVLSKSVLSVEYSI